MNEVAVRQENALAISDSTKRLIRAGVSDKYAQGVSIGVAETERLAILCGRAA